MLTGLFAAVLFSVCVFGFSSVIGRQAATHSTVKARAVPAFKRRKEPEIQTERIFKELRQSAQEKVNYNVFEKDSVTRDLYWAGIRSQSAIQTVNALMALCILAPITVIGGLYLVNPPSQNTVLSVMGGGIFSYFFFRKGIRGKRLARQAKIEKDLPQFLDLLVTCVEAGQNFTTAVQTLCHELDQKRPLVQEFIMLHQEYLSGMTMADSSNRMIQRCGVENLSAVMGNVVQSEKIGTSLGQTLRILAHEMRDRYRQKLREEANKMPTKALFPTMMILLAMLMVLLSPAMLKIMTSLSDM